MRAVIAALVLTVAVGCGTKDAPTTMPKPRFEFDPNDFDSTKNWIQSDAIHVQFLGVEKPEPARHREALERTRKEFAARVGERVSWTLPVDGATVVPVKGTTDGVLMLKDILLWAHSGHSTWLIVSAAKDATGLKEGADVDIPDDFKGRWHGGQIPIGDTVSREVAETCSRVTIKGTIQRFTYSDPAKETFVTVIITGASVRPAP